MYEVYVSPHFDEFWVLGPEDEDSEVPNLSLYASFPTREEAEDCKCRLCLTSWRCGHICGYAGFCDRDPDECPARQEA